MRTPQITLTILVLCSLATARSSLADTPTYSTDIGILLEDFHYEEENDNGDLLDVEDGVLPGLNLAIQATSGDWFVVGELHLLGGEVDYQAYPASVTEVQSQTDTTIRELSLSVGYSQALSERSRLKYSGGIGIRWWERDIQSLPEIYGLQETYRWPYIRLALQPVVKFTADDTGSLLLLVKKSFEATLDVEFNNGMYDSASLDLDDGIGVELHALWRHQFAADTSIELGPYARYWWFDKSSAVRLTSDGIPIGMVHEPANTSRNIGFRLSLRKTF